MGNNDDLKNNMISKNEKNVARLDAALRLWGKTKHVPEYRLYDFVSGFAPASEKKSIKAHLSECRKCRQIVQKMRRFSDADEFAEPNRWADDYLCDVILLKAAASKLPDSFSVPTESGKFKIIYRKLLDQETGKGIVSLHVEHPYYDEMEGKTIVVFDTNGREVLRAKITNGETKACIINGQDIHWETLFVREEILNRKE